MRVITFALIFIDVSLFLSISHKCYPLAQGIYKNDFSLYCNNIFCIVIARKELCNFSLQFDILHSIVFSLWIKFY